MINGISLTLCIAATVVLTKLTSYLLPFNLYFSISNLVVGGSEAFSLPALIIKLSIPFSVGFFAIWVPLGLSSLRFFKNTSYAEEVEVYFRNSAVETARYAAIYSSLLLSWPMIIHWDILAAFEIRNSRPIFILAYLVYFSSYAFMCGAGAKFATKILTSSSTMSWISSARDSFFGTLMSGLASASLVLMIGR